MTCVAKIWPSRLNEVDPKALFPAECGTCKVSVELSTLQHPDSGVRACTARQLGKGGVMGCYYVSTVYKDLRTRTATTEHYGERMLKTSVWEFRKLTN